MQFTLFNPFLTFFSCGFGFDKTKTSSKLFKCWASVLICPFSLVFTATVTSTKPENPGEIQSLTDLPCLVVVVQLWLNCLGSKPSGYFCNIVLYIYKPSQLLLQLLSVLICTGTIYSVRSSHFHRVITLAVTVQTNPFSKQNKSEVWTSALTTDVFTIYPY